MAFQRSFTTIHERISRVFNDKRIKPNKIDSFLKGLYPKLPSGGSAIMDYSNAVDALIGMVQFLKEDAELWEYSNESSITFTNDNICKIDLSSRYFSDTTLIITNFKYINTATIDISIRGEVIPITGLSLNKFGMNLYMNAAADILIDMIACIYIRRWNSLD